MLLVEFDDADVLAETADKVLVSRLRVTELVDPVRLLEWAGAVGANLTGANLTRANLTEANLTRATLTGANLTEANLTGALGDASTVLPDGWTVTNGQVVEA